MTPQEVITARMIELWGKPNTTRLARESGVPRESISKILNYKRGLGDEVAGKLSDVLQISPDDLRAPAVEAVSLASLDRRLRELADGIAELSRLNREALEELAAERASPRSRTRAAGTRR